MQGWTGCSGMTAATYDSGTGKVSSSLANITALTDTRDNNVYTVAKLADGNCWMMENLRINAEATRGTTNAAKAQSYGESETYGNFIGLADSEDAYFAVGGTTVDAPTAANSIYYSSVQSGTATVNISQTNYWSNYRIPRYNNNNTNMATGATNSNGVTLVDSYNVSDDNYSRWYTYGNYYNWAAAMANTTHYDTYSGDNGSDAAGTSLCPSEWKLPLGYESTGTLTDGANDSANRVGSFSYLDRKMDGTGANQSSTAGQSQSKKWRSFPNNFVSSGYWSSDKTQQRGAYGEYWSSSSTTGSVAQMLLIRDSRIRPGNFTQTKTVGGSIRCLIGS